MITDLALQEVMRDFQQGRFGRIRLRSLELGSGCVREPRGTARDYPSPLRPDGAHSNAIIGQEYDSLGFERAPDGTYGCCFGHTALQLEVVDVALVD
jgi:hypothetical protein